MENSEYENYMMHVFSDMKRRLCDKICDRINSLIREDDSAHDAALEEAIKTVEHFFNGE